MLPAAAGGPDDSRGGRLILKNPCVLKRAGVENAPERPIATIEQVYALADAIEPRFRAMVLLAAFTGLRLGELRALRRSKLDIARTKVHVVEQTQELRDGTLLVGEPKSDAGRRTVTFPQAIVGDMEAHLALWAAPRRDGLVFSGTKGQPMRRATSTGPGRERFVLSTSTRTCGCTTFAIPATPWRRRPAPARRS